MADSARPHVRAVQDRRRSNAAGTHRNTTTRRAAELDAIDDQLDDTDVLDVDSGVTNEDHRLAGIGRRMKGTHPGAVTDPAAVAEIRRDMDWHRLPWWHRLVIRCGDVSAGMGIYSVAFLALCQASRMGVV